MKKRVIAISILAVLTVLGAVTAVLSTQLQLNVARTLQQFTLEIQSLRESATENQVNIELNIAARNRSLWTVSIYNLGIFLYLDGRFIQNKQIVYSGNPIRVPPSGEALPLPPVTIAVAPVQLSAGGAQWFVQLSGEMELPVIGKLPFQRGQAVERQVNQGGEK